MYGFNLDINKPNDEIALFPAPYISLAFKEIILSQA